MDASFIPIETVPGKNAFGLDTLRRSYKTNLSAESAIAAAPDIGDADEVFAKMFLTSATTPEPAGTATRVDLVYTGCIKTDGGGDPILPEVKNEDDDSVLSASSKKGNSSTILTDPITVQYYAPTSTRSWFTYLGKGNKGTAPDPDRDIEIITLTFGDTTYSFGSIGVGTLVGIFFTRKISDTIKSQEIVPGKYWLNVEKKILNLTPFIFDLPPGFYPMIYSGGRGYTAGDSISIAGGTCTMTVTSVWINGEIMGVNIDTNSLSAATDTPLPATGGTGTGASFTVIEVS